MQAASPVFSGSPGPSPATTDRRADRRAASVRRRWEQLDWAAPLPTTGQVIPEAHYMDLASLGLSEAQRHQLSRLFACFTCELFVHFEAYIIDYFEGSSHRLPGLSEALLDRFLAEEHVHSEMFRRLLGKLRPDLYSDQATHHAPLHFLRWDAGDDLAVKLAPPCTFFLLAWLFEEITLFVPRALDAQPAHCAPLVAAVLRLHAEEEAPHVAIDERALGQLAGRRPRWNMGLQTLLTLPWLAYVDRKVKTAWRSLVAQATSELFLTAEQSRKLLLRGPSQSDRWGMESFAGKMAASDITAGSLLGWALLQDLRRHPE